MSTDYRPTIYCVFTKKNTKKFRPKSQSTTKRHMIRATNLRQFREFYTPSPSKPPRPPSPTSHCWKVKLYFDHRITALLSTLDCTVLLCTILDCTVLLCTILDCTVLLCTISDCTVLLCTIPHVGKLVGEGCFSTGRSETRVSKSCNHAITQSCKMFKNLPKF